MWWGWHGHYVYPKPFQKIKNKKNLQLPILKWYITTSSRGLVVMDFVSSKTPSSMGDILITYIFFIFFWPSLFLKQTNQIVLKKSHLNSLSGILDNINPHYGLLKLWISWSDDIIINMLLVQTSIQTFQYKFEQSY